MEKGRHSRESGNPRKKVVIPAKAGIHGKRSSFPRKRESKEKGRHSRESGNSRKNVVIPAKAGIHGTDNTLLHRIHHLAPILFWIHKHDLQHHRDELTHEVRSVTDLLAIGTATIGGCTVHDLVA
jgi:hypothetical protein